MGKRKSDGLTGQRRGNLIILVRKQDGNHIFCYYTCDCGSGAKKRLVHKIKEYQIRDRGRKSCGCLRGDKPSEYVSIYLDEMPNYITLQKKWDSYWNKCYNPKQNCDYAKKGIIMCSEWADKKDGALLFYAWAIKHDFEEGDRIERVNKSIGYFPDNCKVVKSKGYKEDPIKKQEAIEEGSLLAINKTYTNYQMLDNILNLFHEKFSESPKMQIININNINLTASY